MQDKKFGEEMFRFCPVCGSTKVHGSRDVLPNAIADFKVFECSECKWKGTPLEGTKKFIVQFKKNLKEKGDKND